MHSLTKNILIFCVLLSLGGCAAGPDFHGAYTPTPETYTTSLPRKTEPLKGKVGGVQEFISGENISRQWWTVFSSPDLNTLVSQALVGNPSLSAAEATLREARENVNVFTGSQNYPQVLLNAGANRQKASPAAAGMADGKGSIFDLHYASVAVSYAFDIAGGRKRTLEALKAQVDYEQYRLEAAYLTISGNVITSVIEDATLRAMITATEEIIAALTRQMELLEKQLALGSISRSEVLSLRAQLEATRATLPLYRSQHSRVRHQITALLGKFPDQASTLPEFDLYALTLPERLPLSLPADLVRHRPDVRAAEALLHAAYARAGIAAANLYPQFTLSGAYGPQAGQFENLFKAENLVWNIGAGLTQPLFNGGSLKAKKRAAMASVDQAAAHFRSTVIRAYQEVADVLRALEADAAILKAHTEAEEAALEALTLARQQLEAGAINFVLVLNAERQYQQSRISLLQAQSARFADTAALFQSLGGGWWNVGASEKNDN